MFYSLTTASAACTGTATYTATFTGLWTSSSFPKDYPSGNAHWSGLVGGSHNSQYTMWRPGNLSTLAIKDVAEFGHQINLYTEMIAQGSNVLDSRILVAAGSGTGSRSTDFNVDGNRSLVSFVTKISPSPDWFAGVHGINLCNGTTWIQSTTVDLFPYDAGTDSGLTFTSAKLATNPQEPIYLLTGTNPNSSTSSFYGYSTVPRMATLGFVLSTATNKPTPDSVTIASSTKPTASDNVNVIHFSVDTEIATDTATISNATRHTADAGTGKVTHKVAFTSKPKTLPRPNGSNHVTAGILTVTFMSVAVSLLV